MFVYWVAFPFNASLRLESSESAVAQKTGLIWTVNCVAQWLALLSNHDCGGELFAKSPLAAPVLISLLNLSQYEGRRAVQSHSGQRRPGLHGERWVRVHVKHFKFIYIVSHTLQLCHVCPLEASEIMHDIGTAIEYLHLMDIAHRDVKVLLLSKLLFPENVRKSF